MIALSESYRKVHYGLRPAKQVERRMLVDALLLLAEAGFRVRDYEYIGMGSIHFIDFAMFHKILGIQQMVSVEASDSIEKRIDFNRPYQPVVRTIVGKEIGEVISKLDTRKQYLVWLDYDTVLCDGILKDIQLAVSRLAFGSVLLVTVDTELPKSTEHSGDLRPDEAQEYFEAFADCYLVDYHDETHYRYDNLPTITLAAVQGAIRSGLVGLTEKEFIPLFNFVYKDTSRMLTAGGMIGGRREKQRINKSRLVKTCYYRSDFSLPPCSIRVPCLTRKEVLYLEANMPAKAGWAPEAFELPADEVEQFCKIYRFFPMYAELYL